MFLLFLMHQMAISLFRLIGALGRTMVVAHTFGSFALMVIFLLGGFVISKGKGDSPFTMLRQLLLDLEIIKPHILHPNGRQHTSMVALGLLGLSFVLCTKCDSRE